MRLRSEGLTWREMDGDLVILDLRSSTYMTTNASGAVLMRELVEERTEAQLAQSLVDAFGITTSQAVQDVQEFVQMLREGDLLDGALPSR